MLPSRFRTPLTPARLRNAPDAGGSLCLTASGNDACSFVLNGHKFLGRVSPDMTNATEENPGKDRHERVTIRVDPHYNNWLDLVAAYLSTDKSKFIRKALDYYVEHHEDEISPKLFRQWKESREHRGRAGI